MRQCWRRFATREAEFAAAEITAASGLARTFTVDETGVRALVAALGELEPPRVAVHHAGIGGPVAEVNSTTGRA